MKVFAKQLGKLCVKIFVTVALLGILVTMPFTIERIKAFQEESSSQGETIEPGSLTIDDFTSVETITRTLQLSEPDLMAYVPEYVTTPEGGTSWDAFGETKEHEYSFQDEEGMEWTGVKPEFSENLKKLDGKDILIQGYMFPLSQDEKQSLFLLGPFPVSCPYHYHTPPRLVIEVTAKEPAKFTYDTVNIKGTLELVPKDEEYNVFYRLKDAKLVN